MSQNLERLWSIARQLVQRAQSRPGVWQDAAPLTGQVRFVDGRFEVKHITATPTFYATEPAVAVFPQWWVEDIVKLKHSDPDACRRLCGQIGLDTHQLGLD